VASLARLWPLLPSSFQRHAVDMKRVAGAASETYGGFTLKSNAEKTICRHSRPVSATTNRVLQFRKTAEASKFNLIHAVFAISPHVCTPLQQQHAHIICVWLEY